jgi:hypothetical protein
MKQKITKKIPKLKAQVEGFSAEVLKDELLDIASNNKETLAKVLEMEELCNTLTQKSKDINEF